MSNKTIAYVMGGVVVVGGIIWLMNKPAPEGYTEGTSAETGAEATASNDKKSMKELMASNVSQKCTFNETVSNSKSTGTMYMGGGKMRGDFMSTSGDASTESHMITEGDTMYMWSSAMPQGIKMSVTAASGTSAPGEQSQVPSYDQAQNYNCSPWSVQASMFVLPKGITFLDINAMGQTGQ